MIWNEQDTVSQRAVAVMLGDDTPLTPDLRIEVPEKVENVIRRVAQDFKIFSHQIQSLSRGKKEISTARQFAIWVVHKGLGYGPAETGAFFGRDRSTVIHACQKVEETWAGDPDVKNYYDFLVALLCEDDEGAELI